MIVHEWVGLRLVQMQIRSIVAIKWEKCQECAASVDFGKLLLSGWKKGKRPKEALTQSWTRWSEASLRAAAQRRATGGAAEEARKETLVYTLRPLRAFPSQLITRCLLAANPLHLHERIEDTHTHAQT